jgi:DNA-binding transcriptional LysR family regulator
MCVVLPINHPLNTGDGVDLNDFADAPFILMDPNVSDRDYDLVYSICMANGFYPTIHHTVNSLNNLLLMVECGCGVSILARHMEHYATDNLAFISIKGSEKSFKMVSAWRRDQNPCVAKFNEVIDECFNKVGNKMKFDI